MIDDWLNLDPAPLGVNVVPLYPEPWEGDLERQARDRVVVAGPWPEPEPADEWEEEEAILALHFPWCDIRMGGDCMASCTVVTGGDRRG